MVLATYFLLSFVGAFFMGLTAVLLKYADIDNVYYGLILRSLSSGVLLLLIMLILRGSMIFSPLADPLVFLLLVLTAIFQIVADALIMSILKRKPVGMIAPLMAIFPLFTSIGLILVGIIHFAPLILLYTLLIVIGVGFVTFSRSQKDPDLSMFDREGLLYGVLIAFFLGLTNLTDIIILHHTVIDGLQYTALKFSMLAVLSTLGFVLSGQHWSDWQRFWSNRSSTRYLVAAGLCAWLLGAASVYTAYTAINPGVVNAIIGINPVFAVLISLFLRIEELSVRKSLGLIFCVVASVGIILA